jgi:UDPglucose 6-dehydrogenase
MAAVQPVHAIPVVYVPEFLRLGTAIQTFLEADRFVIGSDDREVAGRVAALYQPLARPISITGRRTAEMAKHASNAFLALSISFINQIADLCEETGADVTDVAAVMRLDQRIGPQAFLNAGLGYAGGTLGREIRALHHLGARHGVSTDLLDSVALTNERRVPRVLQRLKQLDFALGGARIAVLGLTYKPGTSTLRRSAALELIECLTHEGATVAAFDPLARLVEAPDLPEFEACADPMSAARGASALVLVAPWGGMAQFDFAACSQVMERAVLLDTGNYLPPAAMAQAGFTYVGVGRGSTKGKV